MKSFLITFCLLLSISSFAGDTLVIQYEDLEIKNFLYEEIAYEDIELVNPEFTFSGYLIIEIDLNFLDNQNKNDVEFPFYGIYYNQLKNLNVDTNRYHLITIENIADKSTIDFERGVRNDFINFLYYNTLYNKYYRDFYDKRMSRLYPFDKSIKLDFQEENRLWKSEVDQLKYYYAISVIFRGPIFRFKSNGYQFIIPNTGRAMLESVNEDELKEYGFNKTSKVLKIETN